MIVKGLAYVLLFLIAGKGFFQWLKEHLITCPFKKYTGIDCPGCGLQRSVIALFEGNFIKSFHYYPATIPILLLLLFSIGHLKFDFKNGALIIKLFYIAIVLIIVVNYIYKIYTHQLI